MNLSYTPLIEKFLMTARRLLLDVDMRKRSILAPPPLPFCFSNTSVTFLSTKTEAAKRFHIPRRTKFLTPAASVHVNLSPKASALEASLSHEWMMVPFLLMVLLGPLTGSPACNGSANSGHTMLSLSGGKGIKV